ncbi:TPA: transcriptional regulator [Pseudomonas aeruginosa]|nr:transcriptional regulator [Pseudomonas aeruginosa]
MHNWYLLEHNSKQYQWVSSEISKLGVDFFNPKMISLRIRKDRPSTRKVEKQLFPGYLLLRLDPEEVHTSKITSIEGAHRFVRFGEELAVISEKVIQGLMGMELLRIDRTLSNTDVRNLPQDVMKTLYLIAEKRSEQERKSLLLSLLKEMAVRDIINRRSALVYSTI